MAEEITGKANSFDLMNRAKKYINSSLYKDQKEGVKLLEELADNENAEAYYILGTCYLDGYIVERNIQEAETYLEEAANLGFDGAELLLGCVYYKTGSRLRKKRAANYLRNAAQKKNPEAMYVYALYLLEHESTKDEGIDVMREAASYNNAMACTYLGLHEESKGNFDTAYEYYKKASEADIKAARLLADRYMYGDIPEAEKQVLAKGRTYDEYLYSLQLKAYNLYKKASDNGDAASIYHYAIGCRDSIYSGAAPNMTLAIEHLWKAAEKAYRPAIDYLKELREEPKLIKHFGHDGIRRITWLDEKAENNAADIEFKKGNYVEAYAFYDANSIKYTYSKLRKAYCQMFGYGTEKKTREGLRFLEEITGSPRTERNPLAHYLLCYYYMCIELDRVVNSHTMKDSDKEKTKDFIIGKSLRHHRLAKSCIKCSFDSAEGFQNAIHEYLGNTDLEYRIAELTNKESASGDSDDFSIEGNILWTEENRKENLIIFLQGLKSRMKYEYIAQNTYGKFANGSRPLNKEEMLMKIAFDAELQVEECKQLYSLVKMSFEPLKYADHKNLADVLSGKYRTILNPKQLYEVDAAPAENLQLAYNCLSRLYVESKIKKAGI